ncbi:MAG TPA: polyamine aminopropyltransferase [Bdellovibrionales bacterium]|nr:polyamine aminopropyltransferase [Bdellovibrionales bacterium]
MSFLLLFSVFVVATCGLVYELITGTLASYLLGDSVTQFSTVIGVYLFSMGIGSYLSKFVTRNLVGVFVKTELLIGMVGGFSAPLLFLLFEHVTHFRIMLYSMIGVIGTLVGLEIPLMMRILKDHFEFKDLVSKIFTFDYIGALFASLLFPLILVPYLGLVRSSLLFGILNVVVGLWTVHLLAGQVPWARATRALAVACLAALVAGFAWSDEILSFSESMAYPDPVVYSKSSPYQRIVLTKTPHDLRLFLNGNLQFSSRDEYRYHEALVHVGLQALPHARKVLVLGGGDGLAVREVLKHQNVERIVLVDLDGKMTELFSKHPLLTDLNANALTDPRVEVVNADAFLWLKQAKEVFDFVVIDFPDPSNFSLGKLYSTAFFRTLSRAVARDGAIVVQSTSPFVARKSFWCVDETLRSIGWETRPYHAYVPSFGEWGFILASFKELRLAERYVPGLKYVNPETVAQMVNFPPDMARVPVEVNKLNNQALVLYFEQEWSQYVAH